MGDFERGDAALAALSSIDEDIDGER